MKLCVAISLILYVSYMLTFMTPFIQGVVHCFCVMIWLFRFAGLCARVFTRPFDASPRDLFDLARNVEAQPAQFLEEVLERSCELLGWSMWLCLFW